MSRQLEERYEVLLRGFRYAVHELPAGVLFGADGATEGECKELLEDLRDFERVCLDLGRESGDFIEDCRWHFELYPHYLGRQRHFPSYEQYVIDRKGPVRVRDENVNCGRHAR